MENYFKDHHVILTGASGGIGQRLARQLADAGASLTLADLDENRLQQTSSEIGSTSNILCVSADITTEQGRNAIVNQTMQHHGRIDMLINCAGINPFGIYAEQDATLIRKTLEINLIAPMLLTHLVLPIMQQQHSGQIVNIGSTFGSIAFAWFTAYSTSKFGLRGFSQALRRELAGSGIDVTYIAPRAVKTAINSEAVYEMAKKVKMKFDDPDNVATKILQAIRSKKGETYIGFPESLFVHINAIAPSIVDSALKKQNEVAKAHASNADATN